MASTERHRPELPHGRLPNRADAVVFASKVAALRILRTAHDLGAKVPKHRRDASTAFPDLVAESLTPLWRESDPAEQALERGKVHNLRQAAKRLDSVVVPAGEVFSFWKQHGKATRRRGFASGRQLQEGCLVPAVGGGLCQLSNALYEVALQAGFEILERHPHTRIVPGSLAVADRDATVAWNHIDLRFRSNHSYRLTVQLTAEQLIVRLYGQAVQSAVAVPPKKPVRVSSLKLANSCATCGETDCHRNEPAAIQSTSAKRAILLDRATPEFAAALERADLLCVPLRRTSGLEEFSSFAEVSESPWPTFVRSYRSRRLAQQGPERRQHELDAAGRLAASMAGKLDHDVTDLIVDIKFLVELWRLGELSGRRYEVLLTRWPMSYIHAELDSAAQRHPERGLLADFRAPDDLVADEIEALKRSSRVWTPHSWLASKFGCRARVLEWRLPEAGKWTPGAAIAFAGPAAARKGAYEVRELAKSTGRPVVLLGSNLEGEGFWNGIDVRHATPETWLDGVCCVVAPSVVEERPTRLLRAIASGVPVLASPQCGLNGLSGVVESSFDDLELVMQAVPRD